MPRCERHASVYGIAIMSKPVTNVAASVRQRLLNLARERNEDFGLLLTKYALERLLFRVSQSQHRMTFVLKGALLFELWTEETHRPTRDADFLSTGSSDPRLFEDIFKEICVLPVIDDGLFFDPSSMTARQIKEGADYEGVRVSFLGYLEKARIPMQLDIGFGEAVNPSSSRDSVPDNSGGAGCRPTHLSQGDRRGREVRGDGEARYREHPDERLSRPVYLVPSVLIRRTDPLRGDRSDIRAAQSATPIRGADSIHGRVL